MILETSLARQHHGGGVELHVRLLRGRRVTDFMGTSYERKPTIAGSTVGGLDLRLEFDGRRPYMSWYAERAPHHVAHGHVEPRRWLPLRDGARWTDKLGFRYFQTGPLLFMLNPRRDHLARVRQRELDDLTQEAFAERVNATANERRA